MSWGKIKGFGDGEGNQRGKKEKKRKFKEVVTFSSTKMQKISTTLINTISTLNILYGEENQQFSKATQGVAGRKIKGRVGKTVKGDSILYTPEPHSNGFATNRNPSKMEIDFESL